MGVATDRFRRRRSWTSRAITLLIIGLQTACVLRGGWLSAFEQAEGGVGPRFLGFFFLSLVGFPLLGVLGLAWAIISKRKNWESWGAAALLVATSVAIGSVILPMQIIGRIGSVFAPMARAKLERFYQRAAEEYKTEKETQIIALRQHFQTARRVVGARSGIVLLDDGHVVDLVGYEGSIQGNQRFETWAASNLVGREVQVRLPDVGFFEANYVPGATSGFLGPRPRDPKTGTSYGNVPALLFLEGTLVNEQFSQPSWKKFLQKYAQGPDEQGRTTG